MHERWITHHRAGWTVRTRQVGPSGTARLVAAGLCLGLLVGALGNVVAWLTNPTMTRDRFEPSVVQRHGWTPDEPGGRPIRVDLSPHLSGAR